VQTICYGTGYQDIPGDVEFRSVLYDPDTGVVYFDRTITPQSDPYNGLTPVLVPITAWEDIYIDGSYWSTFSVELSTDFHLPLSDCSGGRIGDGRVNDGADQLGAPLAAYCKSGSIEVWDIGTDARGTLGFTASADEIDAGLADAAASGLPTLISSGLGNSLYATPHGNLAVLGPDLRDPGKVYKFEFSGSRCG
jgi:hypothetical protein